MWRSWIHSFHNRLIITRSELNRSSRESCIGRLRHGYQNSCNKVERQSYQRFNSHKSKSKTNAKLKQMTLLWETHQFKVQVLFVKLIKKDWRYRVTSLEQRQKKHHNLTFLAPIYPKITLKLKEKELIAAPKQNNWLKFSNRWALNFSLSAIPTTK